MTIESLRTTFSGAILEDGDDGFAGTAFPAGLPSLIVRPLSVDDVVSALDHARSNDLAVSVRSGGHAGSVATIVGGGVDIDMVGFNDITVDGSLVTVGTGATWGAVAAALAEHDLALSSGDTKSVGVGGLALGGGVGWLVRQHGLALDSVRSMRVVTATEGLVTASAVENPDLFWALRGGGGNFGVVSDFTFEAHPLAGIVHGVISFDETPLITILRGYRDALRDAPELLNVTFLQMPPMGPEMPGGPKLHIVYGSPDHAAAMEAVAPLLAIPGVSDHDIRAKSYSDALEDPHPPPADAPMPIVVGCNGWIPDLSDAAIDAVVSTMDSIGEAGVLMVRYVRGALNRVDADSTAFAWRDAEALIVAFAFLPPDADEAQIAAIEQSWEPTSAFARGAYGNFLGYAGERAVSQMYPPATRARLAAVKHRWDPQNIFNQNQNIEPVAGDWTT